MMNSMSGSPLISDLGLKRFMNLAGHKPYLHEGDGSESDSSPFHFVRAALTGSSSRIAEARAPSVGKQLRMV